MTIPLTVKHYLAGLEWACGLIGKGYNNAKLSKLYLTDTVSVM